MLSRTLAGRALAGEHIVLWGPRGAGKSTLLQAVESHLEGRRFARTATTQSLDDITKALERAYPDTATVGVGRRVARARLWAVADREPAVLLLDHASSLGTAMKGWLRRLRGGVAGVILAVDVDSPRERGTLRPFRIGSAALRMPALSPQTLAVLLRREWRRCGLFELSAPIARSLARSARGRPGWIIACASLAAGNASYCRDGSLRLGTLKIDTEMVVRGIGRWSLESTSASRAAKGDSSGRDTGRSPD